METKKPNTTDSMLLCSKRYEKGWKIPWYLLTFDKWVFWSFHIQIPFIEPVNWLITWELTMQSSALTGDFCFTISLHFMYRYNTHWRSAKYFTSIHHEMFKILFIHQSSITRNRFIFALYHNNTVHFLFISVPYVCYLMLVTVQFPSQKLVVH